VRQSSLEYVNWQITALLTAERAGSDNPRIGHGLDRRWNVLVTPFANDLERVETGRRSMKHKRQYRRTKGEYVKDRTQLEFLAR